MIHISGEFKERFAANSGKVTPVAELLPRYTRDELRGIGMHDGVSFFPNGLPDRSHSQFFAGLVELETTSLGGMACLWGDSESPDAEFACVEPRKTRGVYALFGHEGNDGNFYMHAHRVCDIPEQFREYLITEMEEIR